MTNEPHLNKQNNTKPPGEFADDFSVWDKLSDEALNEFEDNLGNSGNNLNNSIHSSE